MALQTINIGASANDGSGDPLRTAMDKINENFAVLDTVFNVKDPAYGAVGDGVTDDRAAIQTAISAALAAGGGKIYFPIGIYYSSASTALDPGAGGLVFIGDGRDFSILKYDEGSAVSKKYLFKNIVDEVKGSLRFEHLQFRGTLSSSARRAGNPLWLDHYSFVSISDCKFYDIAAEAMDFHYCGAFECKDSWFKDIAADGVRVRDTSDGVVTGNNMIRLGDDCIAIHTNDTTLDTYLPQRERIIVSNNTVISAASIKVLGAKKLICSNNTLHLMKLHGIIVGPDSLEGNNPIYDIVIDNNIITDAVTVNSATPAAATGYISILAVQARGAAATNSTIPNRYDSTGTTIIRPWNWNQADGTDSGDAFPPMDGIIISNNKCGRACSHFSGQDVE